MRANPILPALAAMIALLFCSAGSFAAKKAKGGAKPGGAKAGAKAGKAPACPAANRVNTTQENNRGCTGAFVKGAAAKDWVLDTEANYLAQVATSTAAYNATHGKSYTPQGKSSYVPGEGNGGIRCPKYYRYQPHAGSRPIALHRVYDARGYPKATKDGKYWTFNDEPWKGAAASRYRSRYAICTDWNNLSKHVGCKLKPGTLVAAGPGESLGKHLDAKGNCKSVCPAKVDEAYKTSADVQVVLHNASVLCDFTP